MYKIIKSISLTLVVVLTGIGSYFFFGDSIAQQLKKYHISYVNYHAPRNLMPKDVSMLPPAQFVPILMYHGVTKVKDDDNTTLKSFIEVMEYLKKEGFQTISVDDYYRFRQGEYALPQKPIIITFDDGRKDSYYTTDAVLKELGFKATIFVATGPMKDGNSFYLNENELKAMAESGRWEIEAHGRYSHKKIKIADSAVASPENEGRFLTSKMYIENEQRLETEEEFVQRIKDDYVLGNQDVEHITGKYPRFFAIPMNDYGDSDFSNFPQSVDINNRIVEEMYSLAFVQGNEFEDVTVVLESPYNGVDTDQMRIRRLEMKNMTSSQLDVILNSRVPSDPEFVLSDESLKQIPKKQRISGELTTHEEGFEIIAPTPNDNASFEIGEHFWKDYTVSSTFDIIEGDSVYLLARHFDTNTYYACGVSGNTLFIRKVIDGNASYLATGHIDTPLLGQKNSLLDFDLVGSDLKCVLNSTAVITAQDSAIAMGNSGIIMWSEKSLAHSIIHDFSVVK